ncbi:hypothetical protein DRJ54_03830, partial [Candidatus Acetothermia bacterium]
MRSGAIIDRLVYTLGLDTTDLEQGAVKADRTVGRLMRSLGRSFQAGIGFFAGGAIIQTLGDISDAIVDLARDAAMFEDVAIAFENLARSVGENADQLLADLKEAADGTISTMDLMRMASYALGASLPVERLGDLIKVARAVGPIFGMDITQSFERLTQAIAKQERELLDELGITVRVSDAYKQYAEKIGKAAEALTRHEQIAAFANAVLDQGLDIVKRMGGTVDRTSDAFARDNAAMEEARMNFARLALPVATTLLKGLGNVMGKVAQTFEKTEDRLIRLRAEFEKMKEETEDQVETLEKLYERYEELVKQIGDTEPVSEARKHHKELQEVMNEITKIAPQVATGFDKEGNAIGIVNEKLKLHIQLRRQITQLTQAETIREWGKAYLDQSRRVDSLNSRLRELEPRLTKIGDLQLEFEKGTLDAAKALEKLKDIAPEMLWHETPIGVTPEQVREQIKIVSDVYMDEYSRLTQELAETETRRARFAAGLIEITDLKKIEGLMAAYDGINDQIQYGRLNIKAVNDLLLEQSRIAGQLAAMFPFLEGKDISEVIQFTRRLLTDFKAFQLMLKPIRKEVQVTAETLKDEMGKAIKQAEVEWEEAELKGEKLAGSRAEFVLAAIDKVLSKYKISYDQLKKMDIELYGTVVKLWRDIAKAKADQEKRASEEAKKAHDNWVRWYVGTQRDVIRANRQRLEREAKEAEDAEREKQKRITEIISDAYQQRQQDIAELQKYLEGIRVEVLPIWDPDTYFRKLILNAETAEKRLGALAGASTRVRQELVRLGLVDRFEAYRAAAMKL